MIWAHSNSQWTVACPPKYLTAAVKPQNRHQWFCKCGPNLVKLEKYVEGVELMNFTPMPATLTSVYSSWKHYISLLWRLCFILDDMLMNVDLLLNSYGHLYTMDGRREGTCGAAVADSPVISGRALTWGAVHDGPAGSRQRSAQKPCTQSLFGSANPLNLSLSL